MSATADNETVGSTLEGSKDARRQAVLVLELLTGMRSPAETGEAIGCSLTRVYQLEERALQAVIAAMEPRPRGRQPDLERKIAEVEREKQAIMDELGRTQALLRAAYRTFGMPATRATGAKEVKPAGTRRRKTVRARKAIARIAADGGIAAGEADQAGDAGMTTSGKARRADSSSSSPRSKSKPA